MLFSIQWSTTRNACPHSGDLVATCSRYQILMEKWYFSASKYGEISIKIMKK
jgi:hypothetical protein